MDENTEERLRSLILMYSSSATNLRKVADLAEEKDADSVVALKSRAKATTYDLVVSDLTDLITHKE
jgi:hypothetical protein